MHNITTSQPSLTTCARGRQVLLSGQQIGYVPKTLTASLRKGGYLEEPWVLVAAGFWNGRPYAQVGRRMPQACAGATSPLPCPADPTSLSQPDLPASTPSLRTSPPRSALIALGGHTLRPGRSSPSQRQSGGHSRRLPTEQVYTCWPGPPSPCFVRSAASAAARVGLLLYHSGVLAITGCHDDCECWKISIHHLAMAVCICVWLCVCVGGSANASAAAHQ